MRVGLVCPYTWNVPGGVQQHVRGLSETLRECGHYVSVIAPVDEAAYAADRHLGREDPIPSYVVSAGRAVPVPYNGSVARLAFGFRAASRIRRWLARGRFDVLHVHQPTAPSLSMLACWIAEVPIVATMHTSIERSRVMAAGSPLLQTVLGRVGGRIAVSETARSTFIEHLGGPADDTTLIPNGVATDQFAEAEPLAGWPGKGGALGFLGRLDERRKGLPVLLAAFRLLAAARPGVRLLLAGPGDGEEVSRYLPAELRGRVTQLGRVSERTKVRAYHSVDAFVAPNLGGESFGVVLAEAMAAGAPIIASDIAAFRHVLRDGRAGMLFETGDPGALASAAGTLLDDPARQSVLADQAKLAVSAYDWSVVARDIIEVYREVAMGDGDVGRPPVGSSSIRTKPSTMEE